MNIVITAGGTTEYIDKVRKITNSSSGKLGSIIANKLSNVENVKIFYICAKKSFRPEIRTNIEIIEIENTNDLKNTVEKVLSENNIDYFIHSMAVSDYYVDYVSTVEMIEKSIKENGVINSLKNSKYKLDNTSKISSDEDNLIIMLKQTPKIISLIKEISPQTKLIGFKLLENVSEEELIYIATNLMKKNKCDYVVANDLKNINKNEHKAIIIKKNGKQIKVSTKQEIADKLYSLIIKNQ